MQVYLERTLLVNLRSWNSLMENNESVDVSRSSPFSPLPLFCIRASLLQLQHDLVLRVNR